MREGDRFDSYILKEKITEGGMAAIFRAERTGAMNISREVCIKCILPSLCTDAEFVRMFIDEARISATLRHSNIVSIDHFGSHEGALFSVMEWVHGTDASKVLKRMAARGASVPVDVALFIVAEVLKALEYAHGKSDNGQWLQIVHRDVTPHNVMVSYSGEVKLTDFGIAKATSRLHHTQGEVIKGKVAYMAPEQAMGNALDNRTDLFAVGVVAYEIITGQRPFAGATQVEGVHAMLRGQRRPMRALRPEVTADIETFVDGLLATEADARFSDAGAALDAIQHVPALATGQRSLQRLMRELYADVQHSTVLPRFSRDPTPGIQPAGEVYDATVAATPSSVLGVEVTSSATTTPRPASAAPERQRTEVTPAEDRTHTATKGAFSVAGGGPVEQTFSARGSVAPAAVVAPERSRALQVGALATLALASIGGLALVVSHTQSVSEAPTREAHPAPAVAQVIDAGARVSVLDAAPPTVAVAQVIVVDAGAAPDERESDGALKVVAIPWGTITVNGQRRENRGTYHLPPGSYRVTAKQGERVIERSVTVRAGRTERVALDFR